MEHCRPSNVGMDAYQLRICTPVLKVGCLDVAGSQDCVVNIMEMRARASNGQFHGHAHSNFLGRRARSRLSLC